MDQVNREDKEMDIMEKYKKAGQDAEFRKKAEVGEKYAITLREHNLYRWKGSDPAGLWMLGVEAGRNDPPELQVYADRQWHPVAVFTDGYFGPAANYEAGGIRMADADGNPRDLAELATPVEPEKPSALALSESSGHLLRAARAMAWEAADMAKAIEEELDAEDSDAEYMALALKQKLEWIASVLEIAEENEGLGA